MCLESIRATAVTDVLLLLLPTLLRLAISLLN